MVQGETMSIMFADGAEAPSTNIMDMVSPYAPGFALWNVGGLSTLSGWCAQGGLVMLRGDISMKSCV